MSMATLTVAESLDALDAIEHVAACILATAVDAAAHWRLLKLLKNNSTTELSQQLLRQLMLTSRRCSRQKRRQWIKNC
jgi:hypothetical protein